MKFADMQPRMQDLRTLWAEQQARDARKPQIDAFAPPKSIEPAQTQFPVVQVDAAMVSSPAMVELITWAAGMLGMHPRLFGITPPGFIGPPNSGVPRLWLTHPKPTTELTLPAPLYSSDHQAVSELDP